MVHWKKEWVLFLALPLFTCVNLDKSPEFLGLSFQTYKMREVDD